MKRIKNPFHHLPEYIRRRYGTHISHIRYKKMLRDYEQWKAERKEEKCRM